MCHTLSSFKSCWWIMWDTSHLLQKQCWWFYQSTWGKALLSASPKILTFSQVSFHTDKRESFQIMKEFNVKKLLFSSSATVYGLPQKLPLTEDHPIGQGCTNPYGKSKYFIEEILQDLCASDKVRVSNDFMILLLALNHSLRLHLLLLRHGVL